MTPPKIKASPLARRLAAEGGIVLDGLLGTGPGGRIIAQDVRAQAGQLAVADTRHTTHNTQAHPTSNGQRNGSTAQTAPQGTSNAAADPFSPLDLAKALDRPHHLEALTPTRRIIADRLLESKQRIPHYYLNANCAADGLLELRTRLNESAKGAWKLSLNDLIVRAFAMALEETPSANCAFDEQGLVYWDSVDLAIAVATEDGLFTPVVRDAERLDLPALSSAIGDLAKRARSGRLKPQEYLGGCFSVSNLGMFGVSDFSAVINPPQAGILAVGAAEESVRVGADGTLEAGHTLRLSLSLDHRAIDGAVGARLLQALRRHIESPLLLALPPTRTDKTDKGDKGDKKDTQQEGAKNG